MKKFTKLFLSCAAIAAVTAAVATSAMAEEVKLSGELAGTYDTTTGVLSVTNVPAGEATILVLKAGANDTDVKEADILLVDQKEAATFDHMGLLGTPDTAAVTGAKVKIGYYDNATFKILNGTIGASATTIKVGDINGDTNVNATDALLLGRYNAKFTEGIGNAGKEYADANNSAAKVVVGDVNGDTNVNATDALLLGRYNAKFTEGIGNAGKDKEVIE